jgi:hypothetical protein
LGAQLKRRAPSYAPCAPKDIMTKKELWEDIQKNDKKTTDFLLEIKEAFGRCELLYYNRDNVNYGVKNVRRD